MFRRAEILPGSPTLYVMIFHSAGEALIPLSKRNNCPATSTWPRHPLPAIPSLPRMGSEGEPKTRAASAACATPLGMRRTEVFRDLRIDCSRSIVFDDDSSSRIGFKFHKYISKFVFAGFWVLKERVFHGSFLRPAHPAAAHSERAPRPAPRAPPSLPSAPFPASRARGPGCRTSPGCVSARLSHTR